MPVLPALCLSIGLLGPFSPGPKPSALDLKVEALGKAKDWAALADLFEGQPQDVRCARAYAWLEALEKSGRWERLLSAAKEVGLRTKGTEYLVVHCTGKALTQLGRKREALGAYLDWAAKGNVAGYLEASCLATELEDWKALLACAEGLLDKYPTSAPYLGMKGQALAKLGRFGEAEDSLNEAVHLAPKSAMCWADLACCYNEDTRYKEAYDAANQALALAPGLLEGLCNRGRACIGLKRYKEGRDDYAAALALKPADPVLAANLKVNIDMADKYLAYLDARGRKKRPAKP